MKSIQNIASQMFIVAVAIMSAVSVLGVWELFSKDVITKSFQTIGLLALVSAVIMIAGRFIDSHTQPGQAPIQDTPNPIFQSIRRATLALLIAVVSLLALLGVMSIWEIISNKEVLYKSLSSLAVLAFGASIIVATCLERENKLGHAGAHISGWKILGIVVAAYVLYQTFSMLLFFV